MSENTRLAKTTRRNMRDKHLTQRTTPTSDLLTFSSLKPQWFRQMSIFPRYQRRHQSGQPDVKPIGCPEMSRPYEATVLPLPNVRAPEVNVT